MKILRKLGIYLRIFPKGRRNKTDLSAYLVRRPALLLAVGTYETATFLSSRVDTDLKSLAQMKTAALTGCPF